MPLACCALSKLEDIVADLGRADSENGGGDLAPCGDLVGDLAHCGDLAACGDLVPWGDLTSSRQFMFVSLMMSGTIRTCYHTGIWHSCLYTQITGSNKHKQ